ncbi:Trp biosynthesis-associated membrane protein [Gryllotalpicola reticulitermitis]|uniref:Trp biosynthesis-associated membrane protein n=1 Tax=Gryllotalpicola reticulitermitis TaxID=1184153 RepID=A0ABV8QC85_9MICO
MNARRARSLKLGTILAVLIGAGLGLAGATQTWYTITLTARAGHFAPLAVDGSTAAPALTALSLAGLALALALAIAGRLARLVIGVIGILLGVCLIIASVGNPAHTAGVRDAISKATGIAGTASVNALIGHASASIWPAAALVGGALVVLGSLAAVVTGRLWPGGSRRYDAVRFEDAEGPASARPSRTPAPRPGDSAVDDWDELTRGEDPTS